MSKSPKPTRETLSVPTVDSTQALSTSPRVNDVVLGVGMVITSVDEEVRMDSESVDFSKPDSPENIVYGDDGSIKGGTLEKILQKLTSTDSNVSLLFDFLITYRSYTSPQNLLALLRRRFEQVVESEDTKIVRIRVMNFMKQWIEKHTYDWVDDPDLVARFTGFFEYWETIDATSQRTAALLTGLLKKATEPMEKERKKKAKTFNAPPPPPEFPSELDPAKLSLHQINTSELARQWTLLEWLLWEEVKPWEFLNCNWARKLKETLAPNILALTKNFNKAAGWVATTILNTESLKERVKVVTKFIQLAEELRLLANFNGVMEILSGLGSASVHRLKQTWEALPKPHADLLANLKTLMAPEQSFKRYRENLKNVNPPTIPYLGISLTDLTFIYDGSKDSTASGLINFSKCRMVAQIIKTLTQYQHTSYHFVTVPVIREYLKYPTIWEESSQYTYSLYVEPRPGTEPPSEPPPIVCISEPAPWIGENATKSNDSIKMKVVKESPKEWKSSTLVIRRGTLRAADLRNAVTHLLYISESDKNFNTFSNTFFTSIKSLGGLQKIFEVFEQLLESAPVEDPENILETIAANALNKSQSAISVLGKPVASPSSESVPRPGATSPIIPRATEPAPGAHKTTLRRVKKLPNDATISEDGTLTDTNETDSSQSSNAPPATTSRPITKAKHTRSTSNPSEIIASLEGVDSSNGGRTSPDSLTCDGDEQDPYWPPKTKRELTMRILEVGVYWGTRYGSVPTRDQKSLAQLQTWMEQRLILVEGMKETVQGAVISFVRTIPMLGLEATRRASVSTAPKVHPVPNVALNQLAIRMFHPEEIARQLALWYYSEFSTFTRDEVYSVCAYSSVNNTFQGKPTSFVLLELTMQQEKWVKAEMTAMEGSKKKRLATYECLLEAAQFSLDLNNFLAVRHIYNALNDSTYEMLLESASKKSKDIWTQLKVLFLTAGGAAWNQRVANQLSADQPMVLPVEWIESAISHNQTERDWWKGRTGLYNFDKLGMVAQTWKSIERSKQPYSLTLCPTLKDYIITAATDALNDVPLGSNPSSARKKKDQQMTSAEEDDGLNTGEESEEDNVAGNEDSETDEEGRQKDKEKDKTKRVSVFKSMFGKKKDASSIPPAPTTAGFNSSLAIPEKTIVENSKLMTTTTTTTKKGEVDIETTKDSSPINSPTTTASKEPSSSSSLKDSKSSIPKEFKDGKDPLKRQSTDKVVLSRPGSKTSVNDTSVTPRSSRGGSASSNASSQDKDPLIYANTPDFRAAVIRFLYEDEDFRSSVVTALTTIGPAVPSGRTSPPHAEKKRRKQSSNSAESSKIAELEAQVERLTRKISQGYTLSDSVSTDDAEA
jgi:hypothetical protein